MMSTFCRAHGNFFCLNLKMHIILVSVVETADSGICGGYLFIYFFYGKQEHVMSMVKGNLKVAT